MRSLDRSHGVWSGSLASLLIACAALVSPLIVLSPGTWWAPWLDAEFGRKRPAVFAVGAALALIAFVLATIGLVRGRRKHWNTVVCVTATLLTTLALAWTAFVAWFQDMRIPSGRPFRNRRGLVRAPLVAGDQWHERRWVATAKRERDSRRLPSDWLDDARAEHASVATFARLSLELLAVGAPPALVDAALVAARDEVRHAMTLFALAEAVGADARAPGPQTKFLDRTTSVDEPRSSLVARIAREAFLDGCIGEAFAATYLTSLARDEADPELRARLHRIAVEEQRHADLGWQLVRFCIDECEEARRGLAELTRRGARTRDPVERAIAEQAHERLAEWLGSRTSARERPLIGDSPGQEGLFRAHDERRSRESVETRSAEP